MVHPDACRGCGWHDAASSLPPPERFRATAGCWSAFGELSALTLSWPSPDFIHQTAVDAYAAQHSRENDTRMMVFALLGLHLVLQKGCTGAQVQRVHQVLAQLDHPLPMIHPVDTIGTGSAGAALSSVAEVGVPSAVTRWAERVWTAYSPVHSHLISWIQDWPRAAAVAARRPVG